MGRAQAKGSTTTGAWDKSLIFDRAQLARYTMDSTDLEREIVGLFVAQLPSILESLFALFGELIRFRGHGIFQGD